ncbi:MAG: phenylalanine--tRNA ligase subunit beta [Microbacteriaceae bacterium]|nr:phenylalanine--tRNA ligase subunit beta [Microbacteriaceae bacterium]
MRIPISWLSEYVDLAPGTTPDDIHAALVKVGFEEEGQHGFALSGPIVVGQVLEFTPEAQSNGKTINWCQVLVGENDVRGIVCGAHNFAVGDKVVVSLPGASLPGPFPIAARKTYGHVSDGMIASARELGLGDEHDGILRLASLGLDPIVGTDAIALLGLDDSAVEINVTPDRGYAFSLRGVAREYAHSTGVSYRDPALAVPVIARDAASPVFPVTVADQAPIRDRIGVTVFVTRVVRGVDPTRTTPPWMIARLSLAGIRSISLVVDITNYVMLELGQPIHGYDLDTLRGGIVVRRAGPGETIATLDGQTRKLNPEDLVIADDSGAIGIAGVMGGAATEIGAVTTAVLIEAANFDPVSIARSARRHKLPSEASRRFERGVDPTVAVAAADRVAQLLVDLAGGVVDALGSDHLSHSTPADIPLPHGFIAGLVGVDYTDSEIVDSLTEIGCSVSRTDAAFLVTPPSWRPDLTDKATLAEEVARIVGYDRIPSVLPTAPPGRGLTRSQRLRRTAAQQLAAGGSTEVLAYPFVSKQSNDRFGSAVADSTPALKLANPLDGELPWLRTTLIPGLIDVARRNLSRGLTDIALFEIGTVFLPVAGVAVGSVTLPVGNERPSAEQLADLQSAIPNQPRHIGGLFLGNTVLKQVGQPQISVAIGEALTAVQQLATALGVAIAVRQGKHRALHPGRTAELFVGGEPIGFAGELLPTIADDLDLPRVVAVWEIDLDALIARVPASATPTTIATQPAATQDLTLVVPLTTSAGEVLAAIRSGAGALLEQLRLVDDYRGEGVLAGAKSLTFALRFRAPDRTLTAAEATESKLAGAAEAEERFGATIRE